MSASSIEDNVLRVLLALASFEKRPADPDRGHYALERDDLITATGLSGAALRDAVDVLDSRGFVERQRYIGDPIGEVELNAQGRLEAERIARAANSRPSSAGATQQSRNANVTQLENKLPRMEVTYGPKLGAGAFGSVWRATDVLLERDIAVKFLTSTDHAMDEAALIREARSLAKLSHPNLVTVYAAAWLRHPENRLLAPALIMELLQGDTLDEWGSSRHPREEVLSVASGLVAGVLATHAAGLVHGDIHEKNVVVVGNKTAKLIDWRYHDTFLQRSTSHRLDEMAAEKRVVLSRLDVLLTRQGLDKECELIQGKATCKPLQQRSRSCSRRLPASRDRRPPRSLPVPADRNS